MTKIVLQGIAGRMGQVLQQMIAGRDDCTVVAGIDRVTEGAFTCPVFASVNELETLPAAPDVLIDFSLPEATLKALDYCATHSLPCVICTTGLDDAAKQHIADCSRQTAVFYSANMSLGVNLLAELARRAQMALPGFDIEIVERHHRNKLDSPSGTALMLADEINDQAGGRYTYVYDRHNLRQKRGNDEIGIYGVRGGTIVGDHDILFAGPDEVITLSHSAYSRDVFAHGALAAALFVAGKAPGLYSMKDMMEVL